MNTKQKLSKSDQKLLAALKEHVLNPPKICDRAYSEKLALRFGVNAKTLRGYFNRLAQEGI